jgi:hypothetical protein
MAEFDDPRELGHVNGVGQGIGRGTPIKLRKLGGAIALTLKLINQTYHKHGLGRFPCWWLDTNAGSGRNVFRDQGVEFDCEGSPLLLRMPSCVTGMRARSLRLSGIWPLLVTSITMIVFVVTTKRPLWTLRAAFGPVKIPQRRSVASASTPMAGFVGPERRKPGRRFERCRSS